MANAPERTRTSDLRFRKPLFYPTELRAPIVFFVGRNPDVTRFRLEAVPKIGRMMKSATAETVANQTVLLKEYRMIDTHSTKKRPRKPSPEFPLFAHNNGQWCRKIAGKLHSFGTWADPSAALERHGLEYPYLKAGVPVPDSFDGVTVKGCIDKFLTAKEDDSDAGQITRRWFDDLHDVCKVLVANIDKNRPVESLGPDDFAKLRLAIVRKHSPAIARNFISRIKSVFKYAKDTRQIQREVDFGLAFKPPSKAQVRKHRASKPKKLWEPAQVRAMLKKANAPMKAMILLGLNAGLNNSDLANIPIAAVNFETGWLDYPRHKTWVSRRVKLWPSTLQAIRGYLAERPKPQSDSLSSLIFVTRWLNQWNTEAIVHEFDKLLLNCDIDQGSFIWFRKTVQTIGERTGDLVAVKAIMGHVDESISDAYREGIEDSRIVKVTDCLWEWLNTKAPKTPKAATGKRGAK